MLCFSLAGCCAPDGNDVPALRFGFWFAAMSCITVILICLACLLMRSALTFRRAWSQEALNLLFMDCKIEQMIEKLDPPPSTPTAKP